MHTTPRFRWQIIPATACGVLGAGVFIANLCQAAVMAYVYFQHGPPGVRPETPTLNMYALTTENARDIGLGLAYGALMLAACGALVWRLRLSSRSTQLNIDDKTIGEET